MAHSGKGVAATQPLLGAWSFLRNHFWLPRELSADQRYVLRTLVERQEDIRGEALFALGYWAGCRVSDAAWLRVEHVHIRPKVGWAYIGYEGGKMRDIDLLNAVRRPLYAYLE